MNDNAELANGRILVIDDNPAIHQDFDKIGGGPDGDAAMSHAEKILFGDSIASVAQPSFQLEFALQGKQAVDMVGRALASGLPFAMAFVDMRMPPGWDGSETIEHLWAVDPNVQIVICSAHSDYDWADFRQRLGHSDPESASVQTALSQPRRGSHFLEFVLQRNRQVNITSLSRKGFQPSREQDIAQPHLNQRSEVAQVEAVFFRPGSRGRGYARRDSRLLRARSGVQPARAFSGPQQSLTKQCLHIATPIHDQIDIDGEIVL